MESLDPQQVTMWVVIGLSILVAADRVIRFWKDHLRESPRPGQTYATKHEHQELKGHLSRHINSVDDRFHNFEAELKKIVSETESRRSQNTARLHEKIDVLITDLRKEVKADVNGVHDRVTEVLRAVSQLEGQITAANANRK